MKTLNKLIRSLVCCSALALSLGACASSKGATGAGSKSLYERLGGVESIKAVVAQFTTNVVADTRINAQFAKANVEDLNKKLTDQICEATGGPCKYTGKSMKEVHTGMGITTADWDALVEDLVKSLDQYKVPEQEKKELLTALTGMKGDIVEKP